MINNPKRLFISKLFYRVHSKSLSFRCDISLVFEDIPDVAFAHRDIVLQAEHIPDCSPRHVLEFFLHGKTLEITALRFISGQSVTRFEQSQQESFLSGAASDDIGSDPVYE